MKSVLITGANKSIGLESARQLLQKGYYVYLGSRNLENGLEAALQLQAEGLTQVEAIQIDVADQQSVDAARAQIGQKTAVLDVLINNAGISGVVPQNALEAGIDNFKSVFDTNLYGWSELPKLLLICCGNRPNPELSTSVPVWVRFPCKATRTGDSTTTPNLPSTPRPNRR